MSSIHRDWIDGVDSGMMQNGSGKKKKKTLRFLPGGMLGMLRSVFIKPQHVLSEHIVADDHFNDGLALSFA